MRGVTMARIRTIKPTFFTSEDILDLSAHARLLYIACWCEADREGRLCWKPRTLRIRYLPTDAVDIESVAAELIAHGLVRLYGDGLAWIPSFLLHQHINPRESASKLPAPIDASATRDSRDSDAQVGRERKGRVNVASTSDAASILEHLNARTGKGFRPVDANLKPIAARLVEGSTVEDCRSVIDAKVLQWADDPKMREYLRPKTLFNSTNFAQYLGEVACSRTQEGTWE